MHFFKMFVWSNTQQQKNHQQKEATSFVIRVHMKRVLVNRQTLNKTTMSTKTFVRVVILFEIWKTTHKHTNNMREKENVHTVTSYKKNDQEHYVPYSFVELSLCRAVHVCDCRECMCVFDSPTVNWNSNSSQPNRCMQHYFCVHRCSSIISIIQRHIHTHTSRHFAQVAIVMFFFS